ncbi:acyl-activating enzyme 19 [Dorcoceras hygrometricum]|uniref:Acyl-activating enzyme 19 n=1 Tax=Dorcoceras hygrometricum TaxID=472368 RepID=A0A2Z7CJN1_9LAMI|nr:acyl-activating enzyme 19 [Dorcoceras hygrometricum]
MDTNGKFRISRTNNRLDSFDNCQLTEAIDGTISCSGWIVRGTGPMYISFYQSSHFKDTRPHTVAAFSSPP